MNMGDQRWDSILAELSLPELIGLRNKIDQFLTSYKHVNISEHGPGSDNGSFEVDRSTFCSTAPTLYQSGRSTPLSGCSENTATFETSSLYAPGIQSPQALPYRIGNPDESALWPTYPATRQISLRQETLLKAQDESTLAGYNSQLSTVPPNGDIKRFFCTFCAELGEEKLIKTKQDWKRHEEDYHLGTGNEWHCQIKGCTGIYPRGVDFKKHLKNNHPQGVYPRDSKEVKQQPRVYACGFENCRELNRNWKDHCDHVATHMQKGYTMKDWSYDRVIRNLLKHPSLCQCWKSVYANLGTPISIMQHKLRWDPKATRSMRMQLEYHNFGTSREEFLQSVFLAGIPKVMAPDFTNPPVPSSGFAPPPLPNIPPSDFDLPATFGSTLENVGAHSSLGQESHPFDDSQTGHTMSTPTAGHRNSVMMTDAPPFSESGAHELFDEEGIGAIPPFDQELLTCADFILESPDYNSNHTPPLTLPSALEENTSTSDTRRSCSRRGLMRRSMTKSKEWLTAKKSQHLTIDHPDIPPNTRLPTYSPRKGASPAQSSGGPTDRMYSYQS